MTMSRSFLFTCWEGGGNIMPALEAARRLLAKGHRVRVMSDECNRGEVLAAGAGFVPWNRAPSRMNRTRASQPRDWDAASPQEGAGRLIHEVWCGPALAYAKDLLPELRRVPTDLVVTSEMLFGVMAACEAIGQSFAILSANISLAPLPGIPPLGPGFAPARNDEERALHAELAGAVHSLMDVGLPALNGARAALGLAPLTHVLDQFQAARVELLGTSTAFDFPADTLPERVRYVGPLIAEPAWAREWKAPWSASDGRPLVVVGFSTTFQNHVRVLQRVIDALAELPVKVLVTLGGSIEEGELCPGHNCFIVPSAPHSVVMQQAALVVTHGGHGTIMRALVNRVPMLVIPHGRDQNDNAVRITERGAGLSLMPGASVADIRAACRRLLEETQFRAAARRLGDLVAADAQNCSVTEELEAAAQPGFGIRRERMESISGTTAAAL
jgi:MGT family glycosyltransferase